MNIEGMSRDERSLLLYFESCAVNYSGRVDSRRINEGDLKIVKRWNESGFVNFGRIIVKDHNSQGSNWVELTEDAWNLAHQERRARHKRNPRCYTRTTEKRHNG